MERSEAIVGTSALILSEKRNRCEVENRLDRVREEAEKPVRRLLQESG